MISKLGCDIICNILYRLIHDYTITQECNGLKLTNKKKEQLYKNKKIVDSFKLQCKVMNIF